MKLLTNIFIAAIFLMSCSSDPKGLVVIERYDKSVSLVRDKHDKLYFQSKANDEQCGSKYWYTNLATFNNEKNESTYELEQKPIEEIVDLRTFRLEETNNHIYYFQDKNNGYTVHLTICDNVVSYVKKNTLESDKLAPE